MDWVEKELSLAAVIGTCTGVVVAIPLMDGGSWVGLWVPALIGGLVGLLVGSAPVAGGHYALHTGRLWPAYSPRRWKHRFAACSAAAVTLLVGGVLAFTVAAVGNPAVSGPAGESTGFPPTLIVVAVIAAATYAFTYALAPADVSEPISAGSTGDGTRGN
ncbi:hypothetical protein QMK17_13310 [Rhodococcus sp. G-MC3]|uniref:hypothetical protein n=1 Tax=Rhodococcus sp. G-MC3 TaxID=3046209 RepID=UPI0024B9C327|nr:hypothetical protein [Rhodococcus sp. G-MC3]MDJ0394305.1 hypothetical protein [Rhodococcus sp. G-MC3]